MALASSGIGSPPPPPTPVPPAAAAVRGATVWVQSMDSCRQAVGGAQYQLVGPAHSYTMTTPAHKPVTISQPGSTGCPVPRGTCAQPTLGCVGFANVPPGRYRLHELAPPVWGTETYAPCTGGSACQAQWTDVTVNPDLTVSAVTTNVYPDGVKVHYPDSLGGTFRANQADPVVTHNFGLGTTICDPDAVGVFDAENFLTGTRSSHCRYPLTQRSSACHPFPWSCTLVPDAIIP